MYEDGDVEWPWESTAIWWMMMSLLIIISHGSRDACTAFHYKGNVRCCLWVHLWWIWIWGIGTSSENAVCVSSLWSCGVCVVSQLHSFFPLTQRWFVMLRPAALLFNLSRRHCANARLSLTTRSRPLRPAAATTTTRFVAWRSLSYTRPIHDAADTGNVTKEASIENGLTISDKALKVCMGKQ